MTVVSVMFILVGIIMLTGAAKFIFQEEDDEKKPFPPKKNGDDEDEDEDDSDDDVNVDVNVDTDDDEDDDDEEDVDEAYLQEFDPRHDGYSNPGPNSRTGKYRERRVFGSCCF